MNGKVITQEQIDALEKHLVPIATKTGNSWFVALDDLREIFDNAPSVGDSEPVGEIKITWYNDTGFEYGIKLYGLELRTQKEYEQWIKTTFKGEGVFKLYKEPQPDRVEDMLASATVHEAPDGFEMQPEGLVAELEAKLKEYEADAKRLDYMQAQGEKTNLGWLFRDSRTGRGFRLHQDPLHVSLNVREAIDQAMKAGV